MGFLSNLSDKIKDLERGLLGNNTTSKGVNKKPLTRRELLNGIYRHFELRLEDECTDEGLLFPTSFLIFLSHEDYLQRSDTFAPTVKELVNKFNKTILNLKSTKYQSYIPHAQFWQFQFCELPSKPGYGKSSDRFEEDTQDRIVVSSKIYPEKDLTEIDVFFNEQKERVVTTGFSKDSLNVSNLAINLESLKGIDIRAKDYFRINFNDLRKGNSISDENSKPSSVHLIPLAKLLILTSRDYFIDITGQQNTNYVISTKEIYISGKNDSFNIGDVPVLRLNHDNVFNKHCHIRYDMLKKVFLLSAIGETAVEGKVIVPDGNHWIQLNDGDQILINGEIAISFVLNK